ncbi:hypothetical protein RhiJN_26684 [Ceratobasidium sp. AG-Ba]|nr:hypothetical protein RhiJN_12636 [Ceratobasidium sp. AG-Ba]QRV98665.1 hypothetical protein RhiJN_26684 [Ceratobasidium sp. AG-Ba]
MSLTAHAIVPASERNACTPREARQRRPGRLRTRSVGPGTCRLRAAPTIAVRAKEIVVKQATNYVLVLLTIE